jgi:hypothetical protein
MLVARNSGMSEKKAGFRWDEGRPVNWKTVP